MSYGQRRYRDAVTQGRCGVCLREAAREGHRTCDRCAGLLRANRRAQMARERRATVMRRCEMTRTKPLVATERENAAVPTADVTLPSGVRVQVSPTTGDLLYPQIWLEDVIEEYNACCIALPDGTIVG